MTDLRKAAKAVLDRWDSSEYAASDLFEELRAALEQQAEPVAWGSPDAEGNIVETISPDEKITDMKAWANQYSVPLYTAPPQRKPLTDDMVHRAMLALNTASCGEFQATFEEMRAALEAAHDIKETP